MDTLNFDPGLAVWTLITFAGLVWVLARFAFKPVGKALDARETAIRESLEKAERARKEAEQILSRNEEQLRHAREEAGKIIGEGRRIVAKMKGEAHTQAREEANLAVQRARAEIDREVQRSLEDLKGAVANLSVRIARQVIRSEVDERKHRELANDFIDRLKKSHANR
jgi:F-type H+-transporting ATPase subunit b